jgi:hypothetical protein
MIISCLIGIAAITPQFLSDYQDCRWYQEAAIHTAEHHHAFELYLKEEDYLWAIATTFCESSGKQYAVSSANAKGIWQYLDKTEKWIESKVGENLNPFNPYDATYMTSWLLRNDINPKRHWNESKHCWNKNIPKSSYTLHY